MILPLIWLPVLNFMSAIGSSLPPQLRLPQKRWMRRQASSNALIPVA